MHKQAKTTDILRCTTKNADVQTSLRKTASKYLQAFLNITLSFKTRSIHNSMQQLIYYHYSCYN